MSKATPTAQEVLAAAYAETDEVSPPVRFFATAALQVTCAFTLGTGVAVAANIAIGSHQAAVFAGVMLGIPAGVWLGKRFSTSFLG